MKNESIWREEVNVSGSSLVDTVKQLVHAGDIRRIIIKNQEGKVMLEIPFLIGAVVTLAVPTLAAVAIIGVFAGRLTVVIERVASEEAINGQDITRNDFSDEGASEEEIVERILITKATFPKGSEQMENISEEEALASMFHHEHPMNE